MTSAIATQDLVKKFYRVTAVDQLNLEIPEGAIYALVGPNGAGKTTAIKILMNIFPPTSGRAEVLRADSRGWPARRSRRSVMYPRIRNCRVGCGWGSSLPTCVPSIPPGTRIWRKPWLSNTPCRWSAPWESCRAACG